ncbi:hypothetical protein QBC32DRAFT_119832 [Pseudoneurospora amorphoporcata]|uniref:Uncharacterized protein n=1 Tax=Pseudoneurospora amorphoporcata TaxID=241081 RepID=A0AAN6SGF4_9PEZI|nr:hypothetical protein QBC32DRAFT_119832 [Pseudoneurospora amorphoporcata]
MVGPQIYVDLKDRQLGFPSSLALSWSTSRWTSWVISQSGIIVRRFFRGCPFNVDGTLKQFEEAQEIRSSVDATAAYDTISITNFENTLPRTWYSHWSGRRDKRGLPICIFDIASLDTATTKSYGRDHLVDIASFSFKQAWKRASVRIGYQQAVGDLLSRGCVARVYVSCRMHFDIESTCHD